MRKKIGYLKVVMSGGRAGNCFSLWATVLFLKNSYFSPDWCSSVDWVQDVNQRVASSIPSQGTCPGCRPGPQYGARKRQPHIDISLSFSFSSPLSKNE